jgi:hypothetical protein
MIKKKEFSGYNNKPINLEKSNRKCSCGRKIFKNDTYYIKIDAGENPEILCEFCVSE